MPAAEIDPLELLTTAEAARRTGRPKDTLRKDRKAGKGMPWVRVGRNIRYRTVDVEAWIIAQTVTPSEPNPGTTTVGKPAPAVVQQTSSIPPHLRGLRGFR